MLLPFLLVALHHWIALRHCRKPDWRVLLTALNQPRMYKLLTWVLLLMYSILARKPLAVFDCIKAPGGRWVLRDDAASEISPVALAAGAALGSVIEWKTALVL